MYKTKAAHMNNPLTHLTLTGYYAGRLLCDAEKLSMDRHLHAMYAPIEKLANGKLADFPPLCPDCKHVWDTPNE